VKNVILIDIQYTVYLFVGSMLCHCPMPVDDNTDMLLMQLAAFLNNKNGNRFRYVDTMGCCCQSNILSVLICDFALLISVF